ncbi:MAG: HAD-IA family hydrolase [Candidatus Andersenbacteria bacterium]|nr:HAD-IA family hydrolase [Candidatus Andersenbacteria bacterium]
MIKAIQFDIDGTLLDTKNFIYQSFLHTFEVYGLTHLTAKDLGPVMGKPLEECLAILAPEIDTTEMAQAYRDWQATQMSLIIPFTNTLFTLQELRKRGIKLAAVSTRKRTTNDSLKQTGVFELLDTVVTGDDVKEFKPDPEGLFVALERLEVEPAHAMMVGDTGVDVEAGRNANMATAGATYGFFTREKMEALKPNYLLHDVSDILELVSVQS